MPGIKLAVALALPIVLLPGTISRVQADIYYTSNQNISGDIFDNVVIGYGDAGHTTPSSPTITINGGAYFDSNYNVDVYNSSILTPNSLQSNDPIYFHGPITMHNSSMINVNGNIFIDTTLDLRGSSTLNAEGGIFDDTVTVKNHSTVNVGYSTFSGSLNQNGGTINGTNGEYDGSINTSGGVFNFMGGSSYYNLTVNGGVFNLSGGYIYDNIYVNGGDFNLSGFQTLDAPDNFYEGFGGELNFFGTGIQAAYQGYTNNPNSTNYYIYSLSGTLQHGGNLDGHYLYVRAGRDDLGFTISTAAVPELSSVLSLGTFALLGGVGLLRRRSTRS